MKHLFLSLIVVLALAPLSRVRADLPASPQSYKQVTKNGKYLFVMLAHRGPLADFEKLEQKYVSSGLYPNDGSTTPLWRFQGPYSFEVQISADGKNLIKGGDWPQTGDKGETEAVSFYREGRQVKSYRIKDLVADPEAMPRSVSHYMWAAMWVFDDEKNQLAIQTHAGEKYFFDVTTGQIIEAKPEAKKPKN